MRYLFSLIKGLWYKAALAALLLPAAAHAQASEKVITIYYDSARTQRRVVYRAQLRGPRPDTVAHGPFRRFARTGSLVELGHFTSGQADSTWTRYYATPAGQWPTVARRLPMRAGQPEGAFIVFHPNGRVAQRGTYRRGQLVDSLVTTTKTGQPHLLAHFDSSSTERLQGSFRQWRGRYTAQFLEVAGYENEGLSSYNAYPRYDTARYWLGRLAAGRLVGAYTEYDADGEPRVRLSYTAQGQYRFTTLYYPAAWLRNEQGRDEPLPPDSIVHSQPFYEWQAVGRHPYLLARYWSLYYGTPATTARAELFQLVPYRRGRTFISDVVGKLDRPAVAQISPLPTSVLLPVPRPADCTGPYAQEGARRRAAMPTAGSKLVYWQLQHLPPISLKKLRHPGRWRLGTADTTGVSRRPARQRITVLADGRRVVERAHTTRTYFATGTLESVERHLLLGGVIDRDYYPTGARKEKQAQGWLGTSSRSWDQAGHLTKHNYESPLGTRPLKRLRSYLKRTHPLRTVKRKLRQVNPMQPIYRKLRKVFPRHDHHAPRPHNG